MTETNTNPFKEGSLKHKIYQAFYVENHSANQIARDLGLKTSTIYSYLYSIRKNLEVEVAETSSVQTPTTENTDTHRALELSIKCEAEKIYLKVKASKQFEDWLKKNKELYETTNLWGRSKRGMCYKVNIVADRHLDDLNKPIIVDGQINFAILRIQGISDGLSFEFDGLLTTKQLELAVLKLKNAFDSFYSTKVMKQKVVEVKLEVDAEND